MKNNFYKSFVLLIIFFVFGFAYFVVNFQSENNLEVDFLDVGQGDSILIKSPFGQNILIDGGEGKKVIKELAQTLPWWDRTIDLMVLTHPHSDHVGGLNEVIKRYKVDKILYSGVLHTAPDFLNWLELVQQKNIPLFIIDHPQKINLGEDCTFDILYPLDSLVGKTVNNLNDTSLVTRLDCMDEDFLFMGDVEIEVEKELLEKYTDLSARVLKIGHHGSDTSSTIDFLEAVRPEIAVIQVGEDNQYDLPSYRIVKRIERLGVRIYRNDKDGLIKMIKKSNKLTIFTEN